MPAGPQPRFEPFPCDGTLNEWVAPSLVGAQNLTACENVLYHRDGGWGKRPGTTRTTLLGGTASPYSNGVRWYRTFPTRVTKLVVWHRNTMLIGDDPASLAPVANFGDLSLIGNISPDFCSMRDPQAAQGNGADVLIVAGLTLKNGSFGKGDITITGLPYSNTTETIAITVSYGSQTVTTATYYVLPTDNPASIAANLADLLNESAAFLNQGNPPFLGTSYSIEPIGVQTAGQPQTQQAILHLGARHGGAGGNNILYRVTLGGSLGTPPATGPNTPLNIYMGIAPNEVALDPPPSTSPIFEFVGGGNDWSGPLRYYDDKNEFHGLSYMCPNAFKGCTTWHDHLWLWLDAANPDTVFASDIDQPEAFTFMAENGGMTGPDNGGYSIGPGDGDPDVQCCYPNGNAMCAFKTENIYQIQGYDFQEGEYQFSVTPQVVGYGIPSRDCVAVLEGQYVFWSARKFLRLAVGAYEPEHIGLPIPKSEGRAAKGSQKVVKVVAGDFQVKTNLSDGYVASPTPRPPSQIILRSLALFAVDANGTGNADTVFVYDDEKSAMSSTLTSVYAWSEWVGWNVGCWIPYGAGDAPGGGEDKPLLYYVGHNGGHIYLFGDDPVFDIGAPIPWFAQTGFIDFGTPELIKQIHEFYLRVEATANANFSVTAIPSRIVPAPGETTQYPMDPVTFEFAPTLAPLNAEALNNLKSFIQSALQVQALMVKVTEPGTTGAQFELTSYAIDANPQEGYGT